MLDKLARWGEMVTYETSQTLTKQAGFVVLFSSQYDTGVRPGRQNAMQQEIQALKTNKMNPGELQHSISFEKAV